MLSKIVGQAERNLLGRAVPVVCEICAAQLGRFFYSDAYHVMSTRAARNKLKQTCFIMYVACFAGPRAKHAERGNDMLLANHILLLCSDRCGAVCYSRLVTAICASKRWPVVLPQGRGGGYCRARWGRMPRGRTRSCSRTGAVSEVNLQWGSLDVLSLSFAGAATVAQTL